MCPLTDCSCDPPCSESAFLTTASIAKFPAENYFVATDSTEGMAGSCDNKNSIFSMISGVLNDLGGQAGLWLGLSVISIIEMCGLVVMLLMYFLTCGKMKIRPDEDDFDGDERIKDVEEVKKELDYADKHDKEKYEDDSDDDLAEVEPEMNNNSEKIRPK
ncbi:unnamed protein product [Heligmosomoides polygyrus]|uniref:MFS domain-containing protein n=1 Tax=Heligmosomoides polygyrus TaxID=6339 RepID=A0A183GBG8_HELPZ|nr:unnamed protein product [Heligmosomoides polygyrus]